MASVFVNGIDVAHRDRGQGPAVALLHETGTSGAIWEQLVAALGESVRTIAPDRRGWGQTGAPEGGSG